MKFNDPDMDWILLPENFKLLKEMKLNLRHAKDVNISLSSLENIHELLEACAASGNPRLAVNAEKFKMKLDKFQETP